MGDYAALEKKDNDFKKILKIIGFLWLLVAVGVVLHGLTIKLCWLWFVTPLGFRSLSFFQSCGIGLLVTTLLATPDSGFSKSLAKKSVDSGSKPIDLDEVLKTIYQTGTYALWTVLAALGMAFLIHLFV